MEITLKSARINAGLTQRAAAKELQISKNTLSSYEKYRTKPDIETAKRMALLYGIDVDNIRWTKPE